MVIVVRVGLLLAVAAAAWFAFAPFAFAPSRAPDRLGTAGPLRSFGWAECRASSAQQAQDACDPPPVDASLPAAQRSRAHMERAVTLVSLPRMEQARQAANEAVTADPKNAAALLLRARLALPDNLTAAAADVNAGLLLAPADPNLLATRAYLLAGSQPEEALRDANAAVSLDGRNADALWIRSCILADLGQLEAADGDLSRAVLADPDALEARQWRAVIRLRMTRFREAIEDATAVLARRSSHPMALQVRAVAEMALGENEAAIGDLTRILGEPGQRTSAQPSMPMFRPLFLQRAVLLARSGRRQDAVHDLEATLSLGGQQALIAMQLHLRKNGFPDVPLDGKRSQALDDAALTCFVDQACGRGLTVAN